MNLTLSVLGRRPDGYHEVSTLMVPVGIHDVLTFTRKERGISVVCPSLPDVPPAKNLAFKAAGALLRATSMEGLSGVEILIEKGIPPGSGMGGGSSDAAAALVQVNRMLPPEARLDSSRLLHLAGDIGADVPFFLGCDSQPPAWQAALCTGTGSHVEPIPGARLDGFWLVVAFPGFAVSTAQAYADWDAGSSGAGGPNRGVLAMPALLSGDPAKLVSRLVNDLEEAVSKRHPEIGALKRRLVESGALGASMTGSGSAVYGVCSSSEQAGSVRDKFLGSPGVSGRVEAIVTRVGV